MTVKLNMKESLDGMKFSTRLYNALLRVASFRDGRDWNLDTVIAEARKDSEAFQDFFLRMPNAGRVSLNEFFDWLEEHPDDNDYSGRVTALASNEVELIRRAMTNVCNSVDQRSEHYRYLRKLQHMLDSSTLHLEQPKDTRPMFNRNRGFP